MRVIAYSTIKKYYQEHSTSQMALNNWYSVAKSAEWKDINDIKKDFNSVDFVGNKRYVFNIKGNDYRLIVKILFIQQIIYVRFIGTHSEYDKITDIQNI